MDSYGTNLHFSNGMGQSKAGNSSAARDPVAASAGPEAVQALLNAEMHCGGCGSKVSLLGQWVSYFNIITSQRASM